MWASLDEEHLGQIDRPKLFKFLKSQGLSLRTEADVNVGFNKLRYFVFCGIEIFCNTLITALLTRCPRERPRL